MRCFCFQRAGGGDEGILEEFEVDGDDEPCYGKRCTANEHCCPGSVCVDVDGGKVIAVKLVSEFSHIY